MNVYTRTHIYICNENDQRIITSSNFVEILVTLTSDEFISDIISVIINCPGTYPKLGTFIRTCSEPLLMQQQQKFFDVSSSIPILNENEILYSIYIFCLSLFFFFFLQKERKKKQKRKRITYTLVRNWI